MRPKNRLSLLMGMFIVISFISCKKKENCEITYVDSYNLDTVYSSDFLAAYPGSWWEYDNDSRNECTAWETVPNYLNVIDSDGCTSVFRDYLIVPKVNNHFIYGDFKLTSDASTNSSNLSQLVGSLGDSWGYSSNFDEGHRSYKWSVDSLLDFKTVNGVIYEDVIFIRKKFSVYYDHNFGGPPSDFEHYYYAKNVGLIQYKYFEYYGEDAPPNEEYGLTSYYIAPH